MTIRTTTSSRAISSRRSARGATRFDWASDYDAGLEAMVREPARCLTSWTIGCARVRAWELIREAQQRNCGGPVICSPVKATSNWTYAALRAGGVRLPGEGTPGTRHCWTAPSGTRCSSGATKRSWPTASGSAPRSWSRRNRELKQEVAERQRAEKALRGGGSPRRDIVIATQRMSCAIRWRPSATRWRSCAWPTTRKGANGARLVMERQVDSACAPHQRPLGCLAHQSGQAAAQAGASGPGRRRGRRGRDEPAGCWRRPNSTSASSSAGRVNPVSSRPGSPLPDHLESAEQCGRSTRNPAEKSR
jgi:hypothetical protein